MKLKGIVLAGGKSSRFEEDKALATWNGKTLLAGAVDLLQSLNLAPTVIANPQRDYSFLPCPVFNDVIPGKGPLGGIYTASCLFPDVSLLVLTCDMPDVHEIALKNLLNVHQSSSITLFDSDGDSFQPFPGIYPSSLKENIEQCLKRDELSMQTFLKRIPHLKLLSLGSAPSFFANINSQKDLNT